MITHGTEPETPESTLDSELNEDARHEGARAERDWLQISIQVYAAIFLTLNFFAFSKIGLNLPFSVGSGSAAIVGIALVCGVLTIFLTHKASVSDRAEADSLREHEQRWLVLEQELNASREMSRQTAATLLAMMPDEPGRDDVRETGL